MLDVSSAKALTKIDPIIYRLLILRLRDDPIDLINIVVVHMLTFAYEDQYVDEVYELIKEKMDRICQAKSTPL